MAKRAVESAERQRQPKQNEYAQQVAKKLIEQIKAGTAPWQMPWKPGEHHMPSNLVSGKAYRGGNALYLWATALDRGYGDNRWMTYKQAKEQGGQVRKGEHGTGIRFASFDDRPVLDANGQAVIGRDGKPRIDKVCHAIGYTVFNACQIDGLPAPEVKREAPMWERHAAAERMLRQSGANIVNISGDQSYYDGRNDRIVLPLAEQFMTRDDFYATALHELGHWTGHESRLNRDMTGGFGSVQYAKEELRAEIASLMLGDELGIGNGGDRLLKQHAAYVENWVKVLESEPGEILRAASAASRITEYIHELGRDRSMEPFKQPEPVKERKREKEMEL